MHVVANVKQANALDDSLQIMQFLWIAKGW